MIVTVTVNTTLDQTVFIPKFIPAATIRATRTVYSMGGKPAVASFVLGELGTSSLALGCAAGAIGRRVEAMLQARGVVVDFIWTAGETRINVVIIPQDGSGMTTITTSTLEVSAEDLTLLRSKLDEALAAATCVITGGTLPNGVEPTFYEETIRQIKARGVPVIFDASEPNLSAGLRGSPDYVKPNQDELAALTGLSISSIDDAYGAGRKLLETYNTCPIITLGAEGGLAVLRDRAYRIPPLRLEVVSAAGAGDAVLAGLAHALHHHAPIEEGLRLGFAAAAAVCLQPGTGDCRRADVEAFLPHIDLIPYPN
jgi:1-phosphofructokinase family hexose kinase